MAKGKPSVIIGLLIFGYPVAVFVLWVALTVTDSRIGNCPGKANCGCHTSP